MNVSLTLFFEHVRSLPPEEALEELMNALSDLVQFIDRDWVVDLRAAVVRDFPHRQDVIDLIDGNLALRELQEAD